MRRRVFFEFIVLSSASLLSLHSVAESGPTGDWPRRDIPRIRAGAIVPSAASLPSFLWSEGKQRTRPELPRRDFGDFFLAVPARPSLAAGRDFRQGLIALLESTRFAPLDAGAIETCGPVPDPNTNFPFFLPRPEGMPQPTVRLSGLAGHAALELQRVGLVGERRSREWLRLLAGSRTEGVDSFDAALLQTMGLTFRDLSREIEREEILHLAIQMHGSIPIEGAEFLGVARRDETVSSYRGRAVHRYACVHRVTGSPGAPAIMEVARRALERLDITPQMAGSPPPNLVLLPSGVDASGDRVLLSPAWRLRLEGVWKKRRFVFFAWIDTRSGEILKLVTTPQTSVSVSQARSASVSATGLGWVRDPSTASEVREFRVDAKSGGVFGLQLQGLSRLLDASIGEAGSDVQLNQLVNGRADFTTVKPTLELNDGCDPKNVAAQINLFSLLYFYRDYFSSLGAYPTPKEGTEWAPTLSKDPLDCGSSSSLTFSGCRGYSQLTEGQIQGCSDFHTVDTPALQNYLHFGHDNTLITHELGHILVNRHTAERDVGLCGSPGCVGPVDLGPLHDLADAWAGHFQNTNCIGGWVGRNMGGAGMGRNCATSTEDRILPRLHELSIPFDRLRPGDHFPEHRRLVNGDFDYADMQIAAAALWQVREGLRSLNMPIAHPLYGSYLLKTIRSLPNVDPRVTRYSDLGNYQALRLVGSTLIQQWMGTIASTNESPGSEPVNKIVAGFAKAGVFMIDPRCIGPSLVDDCSGGDAVVDVDLQATDRQGGPWLESNSVYLGSGQRWPSFQVWTGPHYWFNDEESVAPMTGLARCHKKFRIEFSTSVDFSPAFAAPWQEVSINNDDATRAPCYGTWPASAADWRSFVATLPAGARTLYYRALTVNGNDADARLSTKPGNGTWHIKPLSVVLGDAPEP